MTTLVRRAAFWLSRRTPEGVMSVIEKNWQELIRPMKPEIQPGFDPVRQAKIIAEPLERGFGMTLGNKSQKEIQN